MSEAKIALTAVDQTKAAFDSATKNLTTLHTKAMAVTGAIAGLGVTAYVASLARDIHTAIEQWDELGKSAQRAGFQSAQGMAEFQFAARLAGIDAAGFEVAVSKLNGKMADTAAGSKDAGAVFQAMGVKVKDANGELRNTEDVITDLAAKFASYREGPEKAALAAELFGEKAGRRLIPLLNGGAEGLERLREEFRKLYGQVSGDTTRSAEQFNDNIARLETASGALQRRLATELLPTLVQVSEKMVEAAKSGGTLAGVLAGLRETGKILMGTDELGTARSGAASADRRMADLGFQIQEQAKLLERDPGDKGAERRLASLRKQLEDVQREALNATHAVKSLLNPGYEMDVSYQTLEDKRLGSRDGRTRAPVVPKPGAAAGENEGAAILKRVRERLAAQTAELQAGRTLTDQEKFAVKVEEDLRSAKHGVDAATRRQIQSTLELSNAEQRSLEGRTRQLAMDKAIVEEAERSRDERMAADARDSQERTQFRLRVNEQTQALQDYADQLDLEARLLGATDRERRITLEQLKIELQLRKDLDALDRNLAFDEPGREEERQRLRRNADVAKGQVVRRTDIDERIEFADGFRADMRGALTRAFEDTKNPARAFIEGFASALYTRVSAKLADAIMDAVMPGRGGAGGGGFFGSFASAIGGSLQGAFSQTSFGSAGFGTGAAYGNMDIGQFLHSGGIAGSEATFMRPVHPAVFRGARKYHGGGLVGDEQPAILKPGEGVFTPGQMKALGGGGAMKLTIINQTSAPIESVQERRISATERAIILKEARQSFVAAMQQANSDESKAVAGAFNLRRGR